MATTRTANVITNKDDIDFIANIKYKDITKSFIMDCFGEFEGKRRFNAFDIIIIPANSYGGKLPNGKEKYNTKPFTTTVGRYIFNKYFFEGVPELLDKFWYVQENINKKTYKKIFDEMGYALLEDEIPINVYKDFCLKTQAFMPYVSILSYNHTMNMLTITKKINKRKKELFDLHKKEIDAGNMVIVDDITKELLAYAKELMKDDPAMDMFDSGAGGSFDDNFKNMFIMRGAVQNPDPSKGYELITGNYVDGISKEEYSKLANTLAAGPYSRSKKTELGGYWEKLFSSAVGYITLLPEGSDCGTKRTINVDVTNKNIDSIMYSYAVIGDKLVEINSHNKDRFIGKKIKLRFSSMCEAKNGICNKCAGNLFYKLGIMNVGLATAQIPSKLKNISMKSFHDDQLRFAEMDPMKAFYPDGQ